ncbi:hypothetical protein Q3G72_000777 [Acer saccharum]|nr:hypothetical protein Q3G72_000777 [Acer saccharum]
MNPPFPEKCLGNVGQATVVKCQMEERIEYNNFTKRIQESIRKMDDKYARKLNESEGFLNDLENVNEEISEMNVYFVISVCRFGLYESDFGWGKAVWANVVLKYNNVVVLSDTSDGQGIEAWVGLPKQDMATLLMNIGTFLLGFFSENPSVKR